MNVVDQAYRLADAGRAADAAAMLEEAGRAGDAGAWVELAVWLFSAHYLARDLRRARACFDAAAALGHSQARQVSINLMASGVGGERNWSSAVAALRELAEESGDAAAQLELISVMALNETGDPTKLPEGRNLHEGTHVSQFAHFLTVAECRYLIDRAAPLLSPSVGVDPSTNRMVPHPVRTSDNMAFGWLDEDPVVLAINRRIAAVTGTQAGAGEPLQVLRYRPGQEYRLHHDALPGTDNQRIVTFLVYLNDGYRGGETEFPRLGLKIAGGAGTGLMFRNADTDGRPDPAAVHAGCPIFSGEKFLATRWIHQQRFGPA